MTRLAMEANLQYVPFPAELIPLLASYVAPAASTARLADICAGSGDAAAGLAEAWAISRDRRYLNELADGRRALCSRHSDHVLGADAIRALQVSRGAFQVAWTNPPFGIQPREQGGGRLEPLFFKRIVEDGAWLQPGGVHLMLAPQDVWLTNLGTLNHLARCYDRVTMVVLPEEHRHYRELLIIGVVRATWRSGQELRLRARQIVEKLAEELPVLTLQSEPRYHIPLPQKQQRALTWRDAEAATPEQAQADVLQGGGAWASRSYRQRLQTARQDRRRIRPVFPLNKVAAALRVAEGDINNMLVTIDDRPVRIKGSTRRTEKVWQEERTNGNGQTVIDTHRMELREPVVVTLDAENAAITRYLGDRGIAALMEIPDAAPSLLDAVARSAPPVYAMQLPPEVEAILTGIVSVSGRALPGYAPGYIPMQQHVIAAMYTAFKESDPNTGRPRRVLGLGADMGCGKSGMAAGEAEVLRQLLPTNGTGRAYTALVIAPNHLIGEQAQVQAHDTALPGLDRPPLPQWIGEWRDLLPGWHSAILETPAQVSAFYRAAAADPSTPRVGFIAFSKFSLGSGWEIATTSHPAALITPDPAPDEPAETAEQRRALWRAAFYQRLRAEEVREWEELKQREKAQRKRERQAQRVAHANGESEPSALHGPGVSPRTIRRDRIFRCGTAHREVLKGEPYVPLWHFEGLYCPDCGRRARTKDGFAHSHESLRKAGLVRCAFCGGMLGQYNRKQDNVSDRALPIFTDPPPQDDRSVAARRALPWGERPRSNPRMALGEFLVRRGYAEQTDLVITDEFHGMKGLTSARGRLWGALIQRCHYALGLTGSPYGGKASTAYWLLQRMGNVFVRQEFAWTDEARFVERMGIIDTVTSQVVEDAQTFSGKAAPVYTRVEERAGITAELAAVMQSQFIFVLLKQMGFLLPTYDEGVVFFSLPGGLAEEYARLVQEGKAIIKEPGGKDALSSYLQSTLTYAMAPWKPVTVRSKNTGEAYCPPALPAETVLPHHRWLAKRAAEQARAGRGMLVFAEHTNKLDILADLQAKIQQLGLTEHGTPVKVAILRSTTVSPGARGAWFAERERDGTNVVLCHPGLVETGMNLIAWPEIVFAEPTYSLYRAMQARKRALRPTQTRACRVTWLGYEDTMIAQALDIIGSKATAATLLNGDDLSSGLMQVDPGMSLLQELARRVLNDEDSVSARDVIAERLAQAGTALKASLEVGANDLVGVEVGGLIGPDPSLRLPQPVPRLALLPKSADESVVDLLPSLEDDPPVPSEEGHVYSWGEVLIRRKRARKGAPDPVNEPQAVQFSFVS